MQRYGGKAMSTTDGNAPEFESELARGLLEAMSGALEPVKNVLAQVEDEIARRQTELEELRKMRTNATRVLGILDPDTKPTTGAKRKGVRSPNSSTTRFAEEKVEAIEQYLRQHFAEGEDVHVQLLDHDPDFKLSTRSNLYPILNALAERGVLRVDRLERITGTGRASKIYRLVPTQ